MLDLNCSNSRISPAITIKLQFMEHTFCKTYSISVFAVVLIKVFWFQTGNKLNNLSCSKQALANAIWEVCMHWLQVYMAQLGNNWAALTAYRAELCSIHSKIARTVLSLSFSQAYTVLKIFCSSVSVIRDSNSCPESTFCF